MPFWQLIMLLALETTQINVSFFTLISGFLFPSSWRVLCHWLPDYLQSDKGIKKVINQTLYYVLINMILFQF